MLRETFVIGAESELVMMRWAWRLLSVYPGLCIFRTQKKQYKCKSKIILKFYLTTDVQSKVQAEIDQLIDAENDVNWTDRHQLHYTR